jgi:hypothetical protein
MNQINELNALFSNTRANNLEIIDIKPPPLLTAFARSDQNKTQATATAIAQEN